MIIQFLVLTVILIGLPLAGLGVKLLVQPHNRLSETQLNRYREMQRRSVIYHKEKDITSNKQ